MAPCLCRQMQELKLGYKDDYPHPQEKRKSGNLRYANKVGG